jgi:hypothetical protein
MATFGTAPQYEYPIAELKFCDISERGLTTDFTLVSLRLQDASPDRSFDPHYVKTYFDYFGQQSRRQQEFIETESVT